MPAYLVAIDTEIKDREILEAISERVRTFIKVNGGLYLTRNQRVTGKTWGTSDSRMTIIEFESTAQIRLTLATDSARELWALRSQVATTHIFIVNGE